GCPDFFHRPVSKRFWIRRTGGGGSEASPLTDCQITRFNSSHGARSGPRKSHCEDCCPPAAPGAFFSSSETSGRRHLYGSASGFVRNSPRRLGARSSKYVRGAMPSNCAMVFTTDTVE